MSLRSGLHRVANTLAIVGGLALVLMMLDMTANVFARKITGRSVPLVLEMTQFYWMIMVTFLPIAYAHLRGQHIGVSLLTDRLPARIKSGTNVFGLGVFAIGLIGVAWFGGENAISMMRRGEYAQGIYNLPTWPIAFSVPLGAGVAALFATLDLKDDLRRFLRPGIKH